MFLESRASSESTVLLGFLGFLGRKVRRVHRDQKVILGRKAMEDPKVRLEALDQRVVVAIEAPTGRTESMDRRAREATLEMPQL